MILEIFDLRIMKDFDTEEFSNNLYLFDTFLYVLCVRERLWKFEMKQSDANLWAVL